MWIVITQCQFNMFKSGANFFLRAEKKLQTMWAQILYEIQTNAYSKPMVSVFWALRGRNSNRFHGKRDNEKWWSIPKHVHETSMGDKEQKTRIAISGSIAFAR